MPTQESPSYSVEIDGIRQQFQEQIDYFRGKLNLPSEKWASILAAAHDRAFIVAGAQKADLLNDLRSAVDKAISGEGIGEFRKDFAAAVAKSGWGGWTGADSKEGVAWRTRVIYQTNIATSYAAGRYGQLKDRELLSVRPYWRYVHNDNVAHPRPLHLQWGASGLTLPHDHPFWLTHFPPNGFGCLCSVKAVRAPQPSDATEPPEGWDSINPQTGAPAGIDKGWAYAPGANADTSLKEFIDKKLITYPKAIARALELDIRANTQLGAQEVADYVAQVVANKANKQAALDVAAPSKDAVLQGGDLGLQLGDKALSLNHDDVLHTLNEHGQASEYARGQVPITQDDIASFGTIFNAAQLSLSSPQINGLQTIEGKATLDGFAYTFFATVHKASIELKTMFKRKA